jgi:HNH endonuclease
MIDLNAWRWKGTTMRTKKRLKDRVEVLDDPTIVRIDGELAPMTHVLFMWVMGRWPLPRHTVIHLDGDVTNTKWSNLREVLEDPSNVH